MSATLISARGSIRINRAQLAQIQLPQATETWKPISHAALVDALHAELAARGLRVKEEQYAVQRKGNVLFGTLDLDWHDTGEYAAAIGLRTANDKSMSIQLAVGMRVFVCSNLCFSGDLIALKRWHTKHLDLRMELAGGLDRYQNSVLSLKESIECLERLRLTKRESKGYIFDIFWKKVVPVRLFHPVTGTYQKRCDAEGRITAWGLHNCFTEHIKTLAPAPAFKATTQLGRFFQLK